MMKKALWRELSRVDAAVLSSDPDVAGGQHHLAFAMGGKDWPRHPEFTGFFGSPQSWEPENWEKVVVAYTPDRQAAGQLTFNRVGRENPKSKRNDWNLSSQFGETTHPALKPGLQLPGNQEEIPGRYMVLLEVDSGDYLLWAGSPAELREYSPELYDQVKADQLAKQSSWGVLNDLAISLGEGPPSLAASGSPTSTLQEDEEDDTEEPPGTDTDGTAIVKVRKEQSALRKKLLGDATSAHCSLCGRTVPAGYLWCAHIKPRTNCDENERHDLNNLMLACLFGCDALFESGDLVVLEDGVIELNANRDHLEVVCTYFEQWLEGHVCSAFSDSSRQYFEFRTALNEQD